MERKNINRGFKKLIVWQDAIDLYILTCQKLLNFPFELKKTAGNCIDACHSVSRNIAEGYCRKSLKEYLHFLNIALASSGEYHSSLYSFNRAGQLNDSDFEEMDTIHYKMENGLIKLIQSLQQKLKNGDWETTIQ